MDSSIYTPGAGHSPPVLAGRDQLLRSWQLMLNDTSAVGRVRALDLILIGPRGVGKTATVTAFGTAAAAQGFEVVNLQAVRGQQTLVDSLLHRAQSRIQSGAGPWTRARKAFERVAGVGLGVAGFNAELSTHARENDVQPKDPTSLAEALATLSREVRRDHDRGGVMVTVDEMQVAHPDDLALLAATLHRLNVDHPEAVVVFAGTGLPHTPDTLRKAGVTHPDRLFMVEHLPLTLSAEDSALALVLPAQRVGISWHPDAVDAVIRASNGYPAHLQLFAHAVWQEAPGPDRVEPIDVQRAIPGAAQQIGLRTLGPRWERMPDRQMEYLAALAVNGGATTSRELATTLGRSQQASSTVREALIDEGDIYSPRRGHIRMAVPLFAPYILTEYENARRDSARPNSMLSLDALRVNRAEAEPAAIGSASGP